MNCFKMYFKKILILFSVLCVILLSFSLAGCSKKSQAEEILLPDMAETTEATNYEDTEYLNENLKSEKENTAEKIQETTIISKGTEKIIDQSSKEKTSVKTSENLKEEIKNEELVCTLTIKCDTILDKLDELSEIKRNSLPSDGIIFSEENLVFSEGESVFDIILRKMKEKNIHFEFSKSPGYASTYIEGISNLYEKDVGSLSGWLYSVNGDFLNTGSNNYIVKKGDKIVIAYSTNMGKDLK